MNITPVMPVTSNVNLTYINSVNTNRDGSGSIYTIFTAGSNGSAVDKIWTQLSPSNVYGATAASSPNVIRIWLTNDSVNWFLYKEMDLYSTGILETNMEGKKPLDFSPGLLLSSGQSIGATLGTQSDPTIDNYTITVEGFDY